MSMFSNYDQHLLDHVTKLHFIGCGGSGMFPLIQILAAKGYQITGSDVLDGSIIQAERAMGIRVTFGPRRQQHRGGGHGGVLGRHPQG